MCRFSKVKGREGAGALENTTSFRYKGCHLETWHHPSGIPIILRPCVKGNTLHSQILRESLNFMWVLMGNKWESLASSGMSYSIGKDSALVFILRSPLKGITKNKLPSLSHLFSCFSQKWSKLNY